MAQCKFRGMKQPHRGARYETGMKHDMKRGMKQGMKRMLTAGYETMIPTGGYETGMKRVHPLGCFIPP